MGIYSDNLLTRADSIPRHIKGISCDAKNCVYHDGDNFCTAERITVANVTALCSADTRCATFKARSGITRVK